MNEKTESSQPSNADRVEAVYALLRDYIKHEDGLINHRMTWLMSLQAFLIATFGFSYQKKFEVLGKVLSDTQIDELRWVIILYDVFLILLVVVGIAASFVTRKSVRAAALAIGALRCKWEKFIKGEWEKLLGTSVRPPLSHLPDITGGGSPEAYKDGTEVPNKLPTLFIWFWGFVLAFVLVGTGYDIYRIGFFRCL